MRHIYLLTGITLIFSTIILIMIFTQTGNYDRLTLPIGHRLSRREKILCLVMSRDTIANNYKTKAINATWGRRCDKLLMIKNATDLEFTVEAPGNLLKIPVENDTRAELWNKLIAATKFLYEHYLDDYDWFFKADDDTYLLVDSLRRFLTSKSAPQEPIYFGHRYRPYVKQGYMSGGSGFVLSREALRRLIERGFNEQPEACPLDHGEVSDVYIGMCLEAAGVEAGDSRDSEGRETFLPLPFDAMLGLPLPKDSWYWNFEYYPGSASSVGSPACCSKHPISFHYIDPRTMYMTDWLIYDFKH